MSKLRQQGVEFLADVKFAYIEADGRISIITLIQKLVQSLRKKQH